MAWLALLLGLAITAAGLMLPDRVRAPWDGLVAFLAPAGLASALVGVLLICVPDFFTAPPEAPSGRAGPSLPRGPDAAVGGETRPATPERAESPKPNPGESP